MVYYCKQNNKKRLGKNPKLKNDYSMRNILSW